MDQSKEQKKTYVAEVLEKEIPRSKGNVGAVDKGIVDDFASFLGFNQGKFIQFKTLHPDATVPTRGTECSAGWDLYALEDVHVTPLAKGAVKVRTGIAVQVPSGTYGRIAGRSGLSFREGTSILAGVIDEDYTGEIIVGLTVPMKFMTADDLINENPLYQLPRGVIRLAADCCFLDMRGFVIKKGERFAQLIVEKISRAEAKTVTEFCRKYEKHEGFGSTGTTTVTKN